MDTQEAESILQVHPPYSPQELADAYRQKAQTTHPDVGGSIEEFIKVKAAYDFLNAALDLLQRPHKHLEQVFIEILRTCKDSISNSYTDKLYSNMKEVIRAKLKFDCDTHSIETLLNLRKSHFNKEKVRLETAPFGYMIINLMQIEINLLESSLTTKQQKQVQYEELLKILEEYAESTDTGRTRMRKDPYYI